MNWMNRMVKFNANVRLYIFIKFQTHYRAQCESRQPCLSSAVELLASQTLILPHTTTCLTEYQAHIDQHTVLSFVEHSIEKCNLCAQAAQIHWQKKKLRFVFWKQICAELMVLLSCSWQNIAPPSINSFHHRQMCYTELSTSLQTVFLFPSSPPFYSDGWILRWGT